MAAPVGVVSSALMGEAASGTPLSSAAVPGAGIGIRPWAHFTMPLPVGTERLVMRSAPSKSRRDGRAGDVGDAVERPDFVEVNFFQRHAVRGGLRLGQTAEDAQGQVALRGRQLTPAEDFFHVGQMAMGMFLGRFDGNLGGRETALAHFRDIQANGQTQRGNALADGFGIDAQRR